MTQARQLPLPFTHSPEYVVVDFQATPSNADALAWLDRVEREFTSEVHPGARD